MRNAPFEHDCRSLSLLSLSSRKPCAGTVAELQATIASLQAERAGSAATLLAHGEEAAKALAASTQLAARAALAQLAAREEAAERARLGDGAVVVLVAESIASAAATHAAAVADAELSWGARFLGARRKWLDVVWQKRTRTTVGNVFRRWVESWQESKVAARIEATERRTTAAVAQAQTDAMELAAKTTAVATASAVEATVASRVAAGLAVGETAILPTPPLRRYSNAY